MHTLFLPLDHPVSIIVFIANLIFSITIIFLERKTPQSTYSWLLFLWIVPLIGFLFYLLFSQNLSKRKIYKYNTPENEAYQNLIRNQKNALISDEDRALTSETVNKYRENIEYHLNVSEALYTEKNCIEIFTDGHAKFAALFAAIEEAKISIHVEYYIIKWDDLGRRFVELLTKKAKEGVEVRLLFDQMGGAYIPDSALAELKAAGGEYGIFFPSAVRFFNMRVNYRDHRKIVVVDGKTGFVGGFNVGDEYLGLHENRGYWRDTHLKITGLSVHELQMRFFFDWHTSGNDAELTFGGGGDDELDPIEELKLTDGCGVQIVSSGPDNANPAIKQGLLRMINNAKKYIYLQTPYFVPDESALESLKIALLSGVDVRIMIPNKPDHIFIYWATTSYVGELIEYGARIYIYDHGDDGFLHAKVMIVDDEIATVGSCNFDIRSFSLNFETNAFIYDADTAIKLRNIFHADCELSQYYDVATYTNRPRTLKVKESISRLFAPLL